MAKKLILFALVLLALAGAGIYYLDPFGNGKALRLSGIVEIQEVRLGSKIGGRVAKVLAQEGKEVYPGDPLVLFDVPELETQRDQLKARVQASETELERAQTGSRVEERKAAQAAADAAKARFDRMVTGWREEEKRQAQSDYESAQADFKQAKDDLERVAELFRMRSASRAEYDLAQAIHERTRGRMNASKAKIDMVKFGNRQEDKDEARADWEKAQAYADQIYKSRDEEIALGRAKVAEAKAKLRELEVNLKEATVIVPPEMGRARVEVVAVRPGDLVPPGQTVVRVLRTDDMWVKVFVPETKLGWIKEEMPVDVNIDSFPGKPFKGKITQIFNISEFTPRNIQSMDERRYQVFAVKVRVDESRGHLHAGMSAEVLIPLENSR